MTRSAADRWVRHTLCAASLLAALGLGASAAVPTTARGEEPEPAAAPATASPGDTTAAPATRSPGDTTAVPATASAAGVPESQDRDAEAPIAFDRLFKLPDSYQSGGERRRGVEKSEWQARFREARGELAAKNAEVQRLQDKLSGLAATGGQWQAGAPGLSNPDAQHQTLSYKLHQNLRTARSDITQAERSLLELGVQADLAGVPEEWRE